MGVYSIISLILFCIFTIYLIRDYLKNKDKIEHHSLIQTIGTVWALWFALVAFMQTSESVEDAKEQIEYQKEQIDKQLILLNRIADTSGLLKKNLDYISMSMDSIIYKFSIVPNKIEDVSSSLSSLNKVISDQKLIYQRQFDIQVKPLLLVSIYPIQGPDVYQYYDLELYNAGTSKIYDIKINQRLFIFDSRSEYLINSTNSFLKETSILDTSSSTIIDIPNGDLRNLVFQRIELAKREKAYKREFFNIASYICTFKREIDRAVFTVVKYYIVNESDGDGNYWITDLDDDEYKDVKPRILEQVNRVIK